MSGTWRRPDAAPVRPEVNLARPEKSAAIAYILWAFVGGFGAHRFYTGRKGSAVAQMTLNLIGWAALIDGRGFYVLLAFAIWWATDALMIPGWVREWNADHRGQIGVSMR